MKVEYVTPFVSGSITVLEMLLGAAPERGKLSAKPQMFTAQQMNIVCGITGDVAGQVIYGMSLKTAIAVASKMIGQQVETFDQLAASAIAELGNMISGNSSNLLSQQGFTCDITPPTLIKGSNVKITVTDAPALVIPVLIPEIGELEVNVSLRERQAAAA